MNTINEILLDDIGLVVALCCHQAEIQDVKKQQGRKYFVFKNTHKVQQNIEEYKRGTLIVNAHTYFWFLEDVLRMSIMGAVNETEKT